MGSSGSTQQPVTQQTQQTKDPWAPSQPYLQQAMGAAQSLYQTDQGYRPYTGQTQASLNPWLENTQTILAGQLGPEVAAGGSLGVNAARGLGLNMIQNSGLSPELRSLYQQAQGDQNPYLQAMLDTSNRRINDKVGSSMSGAGRYGSGQHTDVASRAMAEAADPILAQDYARRQQQMQGIAESGLQRAGQWSQLMPTLDEARWAPAQGLMALGQYRQERDQAAIDQQMKTWKDVQAYPWEQLARYNAIAGGAGALGGSMAGSTSTPINSPSTLQKMLGGGLAGAGIGASFGGPVGAGVGALGGGLLGLL
jgi:hypothetical protein